MSLFLKTTYYSNHIWEIGNIQIFLEMLNVAYEIQK